MYVLNNSSINLKMIIDEFSSTNCRFKTALEFKNLQYLKEFPSRYLNFTLTGWFFGEVIRINSNRTRMNADIVDFKQIKIQLC